MTKPSKPTPAPDTVGEILMKNCRVIKGNEPTDCMAWFHVPATPDGERYWFQIDNQAHQALSQHYLKEALEIIGGYGQRIDCKVCRGEVSGAVNPNGLCVRCSERQLLHTLFTERWGKHDL